MAAAFEYMRILALDPGERRIGVAVSDPLGITAQPVETYTRVSPEKDRAHFEELIRAWQPEKIVMGLPVHMNADVGVKALEARELGRELEEVFGIPVEFLDERLTTVQAHRILSESQVSGKKRKQTVDTLAAVLILENYLSRQSR